MLFSFSILLFFQKNFLENNYHIITQQQQIINNKNVRCKINFRTHFVWMTHLQTFDFFCCQMKMFISFFQYILINSSIIHWKKRKNFWHLFSTKMIATYIFGLMNFEEFLSNKNLFIMNIFFSFALNRGNNLSTNPIFENY